jgi:polyisoprenoid-binding protein YceI
MAAGARVFTAELGANEVNAKTNYVIDRAASQFTVQVFAGGLLSAFGHSPIIAIRDFSGEAQVDSENVANSSLRITIKAQSLTVRDDVSDRDRREIERMMQQDVLESSGYPEILYECSKLTAGQAGEGQYAVTLNGELTLHGVTRSQAVAARVVAGGDTLRAFGTFSIRQTDYDLKLVIVAGGALKVKDELKFSFNILARKQE